MTRRSLFKGLIGGLMALLLPKKKKPDICNEALRRVHTEEGCHYIYIKYINSNTCPFTSSSFAFLDDEPEIYTWTDGEPI